MHRMCFFAILGCSMLPLLQAAPPRVEGKPSIWKIEVSKDGSQSVSDGILTVKFPGDVRVKAEGDSASANAEQVMGIKAKGYLSILRELAPPESKKAGDPQTWFEESVKAEIAKAKASTYKIENREAKTYSDVQLLKSEKISSGPVKGYKTVIDRESEYASIKIEGGMHSVAERNQFLSGEFIYRVAVGGSGAPGASALFGDNTGFHKSDVAQKFLKSIHWAK